MTYKKRGRKRGGEGETTAAAEPPAATTTDAPAPTTTTNTPPSEISQLASLHPQGAKALDMAKRFLPKSMMNKAEQFVQNQGGVDKLKNMATGALQGQSGGPGAQALPVAAAVGGIQEAVPVVEGIPIEGKEEETGEPNYEKIAKLEIIKKLECFKLLQKNTKLDRVETAVFALEDYYKARVKPIKDCDIGYSKIYDQAKKTNNKLKYAIERLRKLKLVNEYGKPFLNAGMVYGFGSRRKKFLEDFAKNSVMKTASGIGSLLVSPVTLTKLATRAARRVGKKNLDKNPQDVEGSEEEPEEGPETGERDTSGKNVKPNGDTKKNLKRYWDAGAGIASGTQYLASGIGNKASKNANAVEAAGKAVKNASVKAARYLNPFKKKPAAPVNAIRTTGGANSTNGNTAKKAANGKNNETKKKPKYYKCEGLEDLVEKIMECIDAIAKLRQDTDAKNCKVYFKDINKNLDKIVGEFESALKSVEIAQKDTGPPAPPVLPVKKKGFFSRMFSRNKNQPTTKQNTTKAPKKSLLPRIFSRKNKNQLARTNKKPISKEDLKNYRNGMFTKGNSNGPVTVNDLGKVLEENNMQLSNESGIKGPNQKGPNQTGPNQKGPNQKGPNQKGPNQKGPNQTGPNQKGPNQTGPNQKGPNQKGPNQKGPNQKRPNQKGPNQKGPNQTGPKQEEKRKNNNPAPQTTNTPAKKSTNVK
jgi:hypothetical protein